MLRITFAVRFALLNFAKLTKYWLIVRRQSRTLMARNESRSKRDNLLAEYASSIRFLETQRFVRKHFKILSSHIIFLYNYISIRQPEYLLRSERSERAAA